MIINWPEVWHKFDTLMDLHYREEWDDQQDLIEDIVNECIAAEEAKESDG